MGLLEGGDVLVRDLNFSFLILIIFLWVIILLLAFLFWKFFLSNVTFICEHNDADVGAAMLFNLFQPTVNIIERFSIC